LLSQAITTKTTEALSYEAWLSISLKTVQEFLKLDDLNINEVDLVRALIRWGKYQLKKYPEQLENLRDKILPALPLIRFVGMSYEDLLKVCFEELEAVLTAEEKFKIMQSSYLYNEKNLLPLNLTTSRARRKQIEATEIPLRQLHEVTLLSSQSEYTGMGNYKKKPFTHLMEFKVDQCAKLVGLNVKAASEKSSKFKCFFFTVFTSMPGRVLAFGDSDTILDHSMGQCLKVSPEITLQPGCGISIQFTFPKLSNQSSLLANRNHYAFRELTSTNGWLKVTMTSNMDILIPIVSLVFDVV
jgi:hypothetical protein